jgi:hypothetical protein
LYNVRYGALNLVVDTRSAINGAAGSPLPGSDVELVLLDERCGLLEEGADSRQLVVAEQLQKVATFCGEGTIELP